jgi:hypothetical protein
MGWGSRVGGPLCVATGKNVKITEVNSITSHFVHANFVKTKLSIKVHERTRAKRSITVEFIKKRSTSGKSHLILNER